MVDLYEMYGVNKTAETGVRFQFGKEKDSAWIELKFAGKENTEFTNAVLAHQDKYKDFNNLKGKLSSKLINKEANAEYALIFAETIFVAWDGFTDKGKKLANTKESFYEFVLKYESFFAELIGLSADVSNFQKEVETKN